MSTKGFWWDSFSWFSPNYLFIVTVSVYFFSGREGIFFFQSSLGTKNPVRTIIITLKEEIAPKFERSWFK